MELALPKKSSTIRTKTKLQEPRFLDQTFWQDFAQNIWEKKPLLLKNVKSKLLEIKDSEIFDLLVQYSDQCRKIKNPEGFKFYINGVATYPQEVLQFLPLKKDKSLLGYHLRMNEMFEDYCLVCDELLKVNLQKQAILTEFTNQLYRHVGWTNRFSEMGLYLGNYRQTPFGVHVDNCGVFSFPVVGVKKFRLWKPAYVKKNPELNRAFRYGKHKNKSVLLKVSPGDISYWPSSAWHIAESDGDFSVTWSLGIWVDKTFREQLSEGLNKILDSKLGLAGMAATTVFESLHDSSGRVDQLPSPFVDSIKKLKSISSRELHQAFLKYWLIHISQYGFKSLPRTDLKIRRDTRLRLANSQALVLWQSQPQDRTKVFLCFAGVLTETNKKSGLFRLIQNINSGQACKVSDYFKTSKKRQDLIALQILTGAGAFTSSS